MGTTDYKGFRIIIEQDGNSENPRSWDNIGTMVCFHSRYDLGDKHNYSDASDFLEDLIRDTFKPAYSELFLVKTENESRNESGSFNLRDYHNALISKLEKTHVILPLYLYDHSGITMNTTGFSCRWDSGQVGWIYVTLDKMKEETSHKMKIKDHARRILQGEVSTFDDYLTGNVYGFRVCRIEEDEEGDELDSCWGYFGDPEKSGLMEEARSFIDGQIEEDQKTNSEQITNLEPVEIY